MGTPGRGGGPDMATPIPTLAEVVADASKAKGLTRPALGAILVELAAVQLQLAAEIATAPGGPPVAPPDRALTIEEAADRLHLSPATMQKWLRKPPYSAAVIVSSRTMVRVSEHRLEAVLRQSTPRAPRGPRLGTGLLERKSRQP